MLDDSDDDYMLDELGTGYNLPTVHSHNTRFRSSNTSWQQPLTAKLANQRLRLKEEDRMRLKAQNAALQETLKSIVADISSMRLMMKENLRDIVNAKRGRGL